MRLKRLGGGLFLSGSGLAATPASIFVVGRLCSFARTENGGLRCPCPVLDTRHHRETLRRIALRETRSSRSI